MSDAATSGQRTSRVFRRTTYNGRTLTAYLTTFFVSIAGAVWVHRLRPNDLSYPWRVKDSDLSSVYSLAQALGQSWTGLVHHSLGAPFNANLALAFIPDDLHLEILRILVHVTRNPFTAVNLFYVLTFGLCGISFLFLCERLRCNRAISMALSVAYTWLPYHFTRMNDGHVFLAAYYMLPIGVLVLVNLIRWLEGDSDRFIPDSKRGRILSAMAVVAVGSSGAYYGLFFALLALSTLVLVPKRGKSAKELVQRASVAFAIGLGFVVAPILRNIWARTHGLDSQLSRSPLESIQFGGSISRLYVPWGTWLPQSLRPIVERQEFEWLAVPLLATLGIWIMTIGFVVSVVRRRNTHSSLTLEPLYFLYFWALLLFSAGGLSLVFAYGIDPSFRTWNRFGIVIMTFALLAVALVGTRLLSSTSKMTIRIVAVALTLLASFTQLKQLSSAGIGSEPDSAAQVQFEQLKRAATTINRTISKGCSVLQLPIMPFPEGGSVEGVGNGEHLWLPLLTSGYRWSYGAPKGSTAGDYWTTYKSITQNDFVRDLKQLNFCAIVQQADSPLAVIQFSGLHPPKRFGNFWLTML